MSFKIKGVRGARHEFDSRKLTMKKYAVIITGLAVASLVVASFTYADDGVKRQILKLFPQADTDEDGVISDTEEAAVRQQIVNRFPQADKNGDGVGLLWKT